MIKNERGVKIQSKRSKVRALSALLALTTIWVAGLTNAQQRGRPQTLQVPSDQFPTIQSAINAAANGDKIRVAPGVYNETLTITKRITLTGSGARGERRTEIVGGPRPMEFVPLERAIGVVNYQPPDGGGKIESLLIRGGAGAGILGVAIEGRFPTPLEVKQVIIHQGVRGVAGSFSDFSAEECKVADMLWHGFSIKAKGKIQIAESVVELCGGLGYYGNNTETGSGDVSLLNDTFGVNSGGGILIFGNAKPVGVTKCYLYANRYAGIRLKEVGLAAICHNLIKLTQPRKIDGKFGDGIVAECSENVIVCQDGQNFALDYLPPGIEDSARAGVTTIGSNVSLTNVKFECNLIDLDAEDGGLSGCPNHPSSFDDKGGNLCGCDGANVACQVKSLNLDPPDPVPQP